MAISLVLADDHPLLLEGVAAVLARYSDFEILARCADGLSAIDAVRMHRPDVLVLDLRMPGKNGLAVMRDLNASDLRSRVVVLTAAIDEDEVVEAIRLGARGVVLKDMAPHFLIQCIRRVHEGGQWIERKSMARAIDQMVRREEAERAGAPTLTPRELEVVRCVAQGLRNKEIARRLKINEGTVKIHLHRIYEKLGIEGRLSLSVHARDKGLV